MKVEYINPFIEATKKVLEIMAGIQSTSGPPSIKAKNNLKAPGDVSAVIELRGEPRGSIAVSFPKESILVIAKQVFNQEYEEINEDITDMVGEFVNMISGETRRELAKLGCHYSAGIPETMCHENHDIKHYVVSRVVSVSFQTNAGRYYAEACFDF